MIPSRFTFVRAAVVLAASAFLAPQGGSGQLIVPFELGVYHVRGSTNISEMDHPAGALFALRIHVNDRFSVRTSLGSKSDGGARRGTVCTHYEPPIQCKQEDVTSETTIRGVEFGFNLTQPLHESFDIDLGVGASMNRVVVDERTESGRSSSILTQNSGQPGGFLALSARYQPIYHIPVILEIGYSQHLVHLNACSSNTWRYLPYCGNRRMSEFRVGVVYRNW